MSNHITTMQLQDVETIDPFADPVAYLASLGMEAELVEATNTLFDAA